MRFAKYHALGNDYVVLDPADVPAPPDAAAIRRICHRGCGLGADGVLWGPWSAPEGDFGLRIFNPDGSEAEKSGNGLRIFARYLWDRGRVGARPFSVHTPGGLVSAAVAADGRTVVVALGTVSFASSRIPVAGPEREVLNETLEIDGTPLTFSAATVGNPHCVILRPRADAGEARRWGPAIEVDPRFPRRTNVQFLEVLGPEAIRIEIWERGAGYTLASGTSSCAAAAVAHRLGLCGPAVRVHMPGGSLDVAIAPGFRVTLEGPVTRVAEGRLHREMLEQSLPETAVS